MHTEGAIIFDVPNRPVHHNLGMPQTVSSFRFPKPQLARLEGSRSVGYEQVGSHSKYTFVQNRIKTVRSIGYKYTENVSSIQS